LSLSLHRAYWSLLILHTNKWTFYSIMNCKIHIKIQIKTFKTLLHVSILRSFSGSIHFSLLKLYIKTISELLHYHIPVMWQHVVCLYVRNTLCRERETCYGSCGRIRDFILSLSAQGTTRIQTLDMLPHHRVHIMK
jgi:hypothetical protein